MNKYLIISILSILFVCACNDPITDFGFDGQLHGTITDKSGNIVSGDLTTVAIEVYAQGEKDEVPMIMRLKPDGTYANTKLYPQKYKVWVTGAVFTNKPIDIDLTGGKNVEMDFEVVPFIIIPKPTEVSVSDTEIKVDYSIKANNKVVDKMIAVCSTVSNPTPSTGNDATFSYTKVENLTDPSGSVTFTDLESDRIHYIRIFARASGQGLYNNSEQLILNTKAASTED